MWSGECCPHNSGQYPRAPHAASTVRAGCEGLVPFAVPHRNWYLNSVDELERLARRRRSVRPAELHRILVRAGFIAREGRGSHRVYRHPDLIRILTIPQNRNPVRAVYVDEAIKAIREVQR
ncbi:MAG: type II toxin-antitoxin system HicA family toxin [Chloroflexi bacterium]|nr:type II toxin-antitoxin system HicA family toxin [Chloroflexota bacterium]